MCEASSNVSRCMRGNDHNMYVVGMYMKGSMLTSVCGLGIPHMW